MTSENQAKYFGRVHTVGSFQGVSFLLAALVRFNSPRFVRQIVSKREFWYNASFRSAVLYFTCSTYKLFLFLLYNYGTVFVLASKLIVLRDVIFFGTK